MKKKKKNNKKKRKKKTSLSLGVVSKHCKRFKFNRKYVEIDLLLTDKKWTTLRRVPRGWEKGGGDGEWDSGNSHDRGERTKPSRSDNVINGTKRFSPTSFSSFCNCTTRKKPCYFDSSRNVRRWAKTFRVPENTILQAPFIIAITADSQRSCSISLVNFIRKYKVELVKYPSRCTTWIIKKKEQCFHVSHHARNWNCFRTQRTSSTSISFLLLAPLYFSPHLSSLDKNDPYNWKSKRRESTMETS